MKAEVTKIHLGIFVYGLIFFLSRVPGLLALGPGSNGAEDQKPMLDGQTEAIATARRDCVETWKVTESQGSAKTAPFWNWAQVGGRWWFLGDDSELETTTCDARPSSFLRSFIPKWLRDFDLLQLDPEHLLWTFCAKETTLDDNLMDCQIPRHICGLPVVVMLPTTPCQILEQPVLDEIRIDPACALKAEDLHSLWDAFPFATGLCIWMSGHLQLLAPHLSNAEIAALGIPSRAAGLQVSISRWSPAPTAADLDPSSQQSQSDPSLTSDQSSRMLLKRRGTNGRQHSQSVRLGDTARTNGMDGHGPQHNSAPIMRSSASRTPTTVWPSIDQTIPTLRSPVLRQAIPGPAFSLSTLTSDLDAVPAREAGRSLDINSRLRIGNRVSTAGVKVKMSSGPFIGRAFLSASTHAVFEGKTGKRLRTRSPSWKKKKKGKNIFARIFRSAPTPEAITLAEVEVRDLYGNMVSRSYINILLGVVTQIN